MRLLFVIFFLLNLFLLHAQHYRGEITQTALNKGNIHSNYHAIIISVNQYQDDKIGDLSEPKKDGDKLFSILTSKYSFHAENIIRLIDPTESDIIEAIEKKRKALTAEHNLLIFYAGHGIWDANLKMGYWLPSDAKSDNPSNWVPNNQLTTYLAAFQSNHILLISDACFGGSIFKSRSIENMDQGTVRLYSLTSRKALTSGNLKEVPDESVFMKYFIKELEQNENAFLTSDQLFSKIRPKIINNSDTEPQYGVINNTGDEGGEFVFYVAGGVSKSVTVEEQKLSEILYQSKEKEIRTIINGDNKYLNIPKRVAILNFDNTSGKISEFGDIGGPLRDMLNTDLAVVKNLTMVDRQALEKVLSEQNLNNSTRFDQSTATKLGKILGAEVIITGTYFEFYGNLRVDAKFINVETGEITFSVGVDGARERLFDLKSSLANKIIEKLK